MKSSTVARAAQGKLLEAHCCVIIKIDAYILDSAVKLSLYTVACAAPIGYNYSLQPLNFLLQLDSDKWTSSQTAEMEILNTWSEESPHNYHNNTHTTKVFNCPGAKLFVIEFDPRCHTERKYDYLEFVNHQGISHKYDQKVGTDSWPLKVEIKGSKLEFTFHSAPSNNEWGYKFTVSCLMYFNT